MNEKLDSYIRARNAHRSAEREADGFVSGSRIASLKMSKASEMKALEAIADWVEEQARSALVKQANSYATSNSNRPSAKRDI